MKLKNTPEEITALITALKPLYAKLFTCWSCDPKLDAQRNLSGRTHYVDDDTLKWHKSRVLTSDIVNGSQGLLFSITTSDALNMNNTKRGFRCVVFDIFGTTVYHPDLEGAFSTSRAAEKACSEAEIDLVAHYRNAIEDKLANILRDAETMTKALWSISSTITAPVAA